MINKQIYIIGNWKSNKNKQEAEAWFAGFSTGPAAKVSHPQLTVVVCPVYVHTALAQWRIGEKQLPLKVGVQDVSAYPSGAYTGEVTAVMVKEYADFALIGHSERRKYFKEDDELLSQKVTQAISAGVTPVYCVPDENTAVPASTPIIAYEPVWAIGTGKADTPENANKVVELIKQKNPNKAVLYGGSVTADNVVSFVTQPSIDGVLPGGASLDPIKFSQMIVNVFNS